MKKVWNALFGNKEIEEVKESNAVPKVEIEDERIRYLSNLLCGYWEWLPEDRVRFSDPYVFYTFEKNNVRYTLSAHTPSGMLDLTGVVEEEVIRIAYSWTIGGYTRSFDFHLEELSDSSKEKIKKMLFDLYDEISLIVETKQLEEETKKQQRLQEFEENQQKFVHFLEKRL